MAYTVIFGGTFNPLHIGHYEMLKALQNADFVEKILLMPDRIPPHKVCDYMADDKHRIEMCRIAAQDFGKAELCLIEFERNGKSYSYDTIMLLKQKYNDKNFAFVCGGDMLIGLDKWYRYEDLIKQVPFIVFKRTDIDENLFYERVEYFRMLGADITVMENSVTSVSSTYVRNNISESERLIQKKIYSYIMEKRVYRCEKS